jgi:hypothetical protein
VEGKGVEWQKRRERVLFGAANATLEGPSMEEKKSPRPRKERKERKYFAVISTDRLLL